MERDTKRSTSFIKRAEFENARKLLFGTERIPGAKGRERWTTAGLVKLPFSGKIKFQLGKFTFDIKNDGSIILIHDNKWLSIGKLYTDAIDIKIMNYITNATYTTIKLPGWRDPNLNSITYSKFKKDLFYNAVYVYELGYRINPPFVNKFLLPDQLDEIANRKSPFEKIQVMFNVNYPEKTESFALGETNEPFRESTVVHLSDDAKMIVHSEREGINFLIAGKIPTNVMRPIFGEEEEKQLCFYIVGKKTECILLSDMQYIAEAVNMLMHVLTGPDPRSYYPATDGKDPDLPFKETSDPFTSYFVFTQDEDGAHYASWEDEIYFFKYNEKSMTYNEAIKVRDYVIDYLMRYQGADFAYNYAKFMAGQMENMPAYTPEEFKRALYRIRRFELWEYMGGEVY